MRLLKILSMKKALLILMSIAFSSGTFAQTDEELAEFARKAQDPLADVKALLSKTGGNLAVGGGAGKDKIQFSKGSGASDVEAFLGGSSLGVFQPTGLLAFGQGGDDDIKVDGGVDVDARLYGDDGNDRIKGGAGDDVILGGNGNDLIIGGSGRDLLIGGAGGDRVVGNAHDDILISGYTIYDYDAAGRLQRNHEAAFTSIMAEWTSDGDYLTRAAHINGATTGGLNGDYLLSKSGGTVLDDGDRDVLTGSSGEDWFFFDTSKDRVTDLTDEVFENDLDFILGS